MNAMMGWLKTLSQREQRKAERQHKLPLVAHYWDGGAPMAHAVRDISRCGLYLLTEQRWYPGTLVMLSLQRKDVAEADPNRSITVKAQVIRSDADGVGFSFITPDQPTRAAVRNNPMGGVDRKTFEQFLGRLCGDRGQALIEYALLLPLVFLLIVNLVNFGGFFCAWIGVSNAARAGADYAILGGAAAGGLSPATVSQVTALITQDIASLPNNASLSVNICQNSNGTVTTLSGTCSSVPSDPEPGNYVLTSIDVTYTYVPFISAGFQFPNLNIYATIPPTTLHRRAVMRVLQ